MSKINYTQLGAGVLFNVFKTAQKARKLNTPQVIYTAAGNPWLVVKYTPIFKRARFEVTDIYGENLKKELEKASKKVITLAHTEKITPLGAGFSVFFNNSII